MYEVLKVKNNKMELEKRILEYIYIYIYIYTYIYILYIIYYIYIISEKAVQNLVPTFTNYNHLPRVV